MAALESGGIENSLNRASPRGTGDKPQRAILVLIPQAGDDH